VYHPGRRLSTPSRPTFSRRAAFSLSRSTYRPEAGSAPASRPLPVLSSPDRPVFNVKTHRPKERPPSSFFPPAGSGVLCVSASLR
jgi:hypothetical protein